MINCSSVMPTDSQSTESIRPPTSLISTMWDVYTDDENKFECIIFKMSPGLNELRNLSWKVLYV